MIKFIKKAFLGVAALLFVAIILCLIISSQYTSYSVTKQAEATDGYIQTNGAEYIYTDESLEAKQAAEKIADFVESLPVGTSDNFTSEWKVIIGKSTPGTSSYAGLSSWQSHVVYINTHEDTSLIYRVFVHEFGHYFDMAQGFHSESKEFQEIFAKYKDTFKEQDEMVPEKYSTSSVQEFFASVCKEYFLYPDHLKDTAPNAYDYFDNALQAASSKQSDIQQIQNNIIAFLRSQRLQYQNRR